MAYVRLDKIKADAHIESVVSTTDLRQGQFVALGALQADGEAREATIAPATEHVVMHCSVPLQYGNEREEDFVLKAGKIGRAYVLEKGDIISVSEDLIDGAEVGTTFAPTGDGGTGAVWTATGDGGTYSVEAELIDIETDVIVGNLYVLRVTKSEA